VAPPRPAPSSDLEGQIDALYQRPLTEFTAARNALAKTLPSAEAARVKKLEKPSVIAWAVNQIWWHARSVYDRLLAAGEALRRAEITALEKSGAAKPRRPSVREATEAHRKATADAVHQAVRLSTQGGVHPQIDTLTRMLESISIAPLGAHPHGRFVEAVQPAGFEALLGVTPATVPASSGTAKPRVADATLSTKSSAAASRRAAEAARRQVIDDATNALTRAREEEDEARAQFEQRAAELDLAERSLARVRQEHEAARTALRQAERARAKAEASLAAISAKQSDF
jgi:uncharacterized protein YhaN